MNFIFDWESEIVNQLGLNTVVRKLKSCLEKSSSTKGRFTRE